MKDKCISADEGLAQEKSGERKPNKWESLAIFCLKKDFLDAFTDSQNTLIPR